jgi:wobble nucleotide-excising tRNase
MFRSWATVARRKEKEMKIKITHTDISSLEADAYVIMAYDAQGREYTLLTPEGDFCTFDRATTARRFEAKVAAKGAINADLWTCRAPYGTEAWLADGMELRAIEDEQAGW